MGAGHDQPLLMEMVLICFKKGGVALRVNVLRVNTFSSFFLFYTIEAIIWAMTVSTGIYWKYTVPTEEHHRAVLKRTLRRILS